MRVTRQGSGSAAALIGCAAGWLACAAGWLDCGAARAQSAGEWGSSKQLWHETCGYCHDDRIAGELRGAGLTPQAIVTAVRNGDKAMPAFSASQISDQELEQLAQWVTTQKAPGPRPDDRTRVPRHGTRQRSR